MLFYGKMHKQWIILFILLASAQDSGGLIGNACYGTNIACDFYSLQCPEGEIIHLNNLLAGGKSEPTCRSEQHCSGGLDCCSYNQGDLTSIFNLENTYHTYRNCSGRQSCVAIQAPWQRLDTQTFSSYVQIEYNCESASTKIPMCGSKPSIYTSSAEIWFDGSTETFDPTKASKECRCTVKNNQIGMGLQLFMYLLDVRLESHYVGNVSSAACSSALFSSEMIVIRCANTTQHWETNFKYIDANSFPHQYSKVLQSGQTTEIGLANLYKNGQRDAPAMVWIKITPERPTDTFEIMCEEVTPADLTTIPTTVATTTTTPTTTTTTPTTTTTTPTTTTTTTPTTTKTTSTTTTTTPTTTTTTSTTTTTPTTTTTSTTTTTTSTTTTTPTTTTTTPSTIKTSQATTTTTPKTTKITPTTTITPPPTTTSTTPTTKTTTPTTRTTTPTTTTTRTSTTTIKTTTTVTRMAPATTRRTTNAPMTTSGTAPLVNDSDDNDTKTKIYLAILVPIAAAIAFGVIFCMWLYWKRNNKRPLKLLHQKKQRTKSEIYRVFSNPKGDNVLEDIIKREHGLRTPSLHESKPASVFGPDQPSFSHYVSGVPDPYEDAFVVGPSHAHANPIYEYVDDKKSPDGNGPYVIPLNVTEEKPDKLPEPQSNGIRPRTTYIKLKHARPSTKSNVPATSDLTDSTKDIADVYEPGETKGDLQNSANKIPGTPRPIVNTNPDGSVTVHIDNVSNPSVPNSARSTPGASSPVSSRTRSPERGGNGAVIQI